MSVNASEEQVQKIILEDEARRLRKHLIDTRTALLQVDEELAQVRKELDERTMQLVQMGSVLASVQWGDSKGYGTIAMRHCPACGRLYSEGHRDDCSVGEALHMLVAREKGTD